MRLTGQAEFRVVITVVNDLDEDGKSDAEDEDKDGDTIENAVEEANGTNPDKADTDDDGVRDDVDNCDKVANAVADCDDSAATDHEQCDDDNDGLGNICDPFPLCDQNDPDDDGVHNCSTGGVPNDNCLAIANPKADCDNNPGTPDIQCDDDEDGVGNECDDCPGDTFNDPDQDGLCAFDTDGVTVIDNCGGDINGDGVLTPDEIVEPGNDTHPHNNVPSDCDSDPSTPMEQCDRDNDDIGDVCDACPDDATNDIDDDGVCEDVDNCPNKKNTPDCFDTDGTTPIQCNVDGDTKGDACDDNIDGDAKDNAPDDNCEFVANDDQADNDGDDVGDVCDDDDDDDGVDDVDADGAVLDNCQFEANANQSDLDDDDIGFKCDPSVTIPAAVHGDGFATSTITGHARAGTVALTFESQDTGCSAATCTEPGVCVVDTADDVYCKSYDAGDADSDWLNIPSGLAADISAPYVTQDGVAYFATQTTATTYDLRMIDGETAPPAFTAAVQSQASFVDAPDGTSIAQVKTAVAGNPGSYHLEDVTSGQPALLKEAAGSAAPIALDPFEMPCVATGCGTDVGGNAGDRMGPFLGLDQSLYMPFVAATGKIALWAYTNVGTFAAVEAPLGVSSLAPVDAAGLRFLKEDALTGTPWYCMTRDGSFAEYFRVDGGQVLHHYKSSFPSCDVVEARQSPGGVWFLLGPGAVQTQRRLTFWNPVSDLSGDITPSAGAGADTDVVVHFAGKNEVYIERIEPDAQTPPADRSVFFRWNQSLTCSSINFDCVDPVGSSPLYNPVVATDDSGWFGAVGVDVSIFESNPTIVARRYHPVEASTAVDADLKTTGGGTTGSQVNVMKAWMSPQGDLWALFSASPSTILSVFPSAGLPPEPSGNGLATVAGGAMVSFHPAGTLVSIRANTFVGTLKYAVKDGSGITLNDFGPLAAQVPVSLGRSAHSLFLDSGLADGAPVNWVSYQDGSNEFVIAKFAPGTPPTLTTAVSGLAGPPTPAMMGADQNPWFTYETATGFGAGTVDMISGEFAAYVEGVERLDLIRQRVDERAMLWGLLVRKVSAGALSVCKLPVLGDTQPEDVGCTQASPAGHDVSWGPWVSTEGVAHMVTKTGGGGANPDVLLWRNLEATQDISALD